MRRPPLLTGLLGVGTRLSSYADGRETPVCGSDMTDALTAW